MDAEKREKGHGLMCVIFATDLYAAMAKDGYKLPTNGSFGPATSEFIRSHITDYMSQTRALSPPASEAVVPEGWVLSLADPTQPMRDAGNRAIRMCDTEPGMGMADRAFYAYTAMLAATPSPPVGEKGGGS
jgi:hypothetical protein